MRTLTKYLFENIQNIFEAAFSDAPLDVTTCRQYFDEHFARGKNIPTEFIEYMFNLWKDHFDNKPNNIPFRCNGKQGKIARAYEVFKNDIVDYCKSIKCQVSTNDSSIKIANVKFDWGDGSLKGVRAEKGLSYEDTVVSQIIELVQSIAGAHQNGKLNEKEYNNIITNPDLYHWFNMYDMGGLDELLDMYIKNPDTDLSKIVVKTGAESTHRNSKNELFDNEFVVTDSNIEQVLKDSGRIIADVTINTKTPQYISVKMKAAQLSGVNFQAAMARNQIFKDAVIKHEKYDEVKDEKDMIAFNNLCLTLGLVPEDVYNKYRQLYMGGMDDTNLELNKNFDQSLLGCLFQKLLGGNYWYVKPGVCEYVDYKNAKLKVNISNASITNTGKGIELKGDINGLTCGIQFRTDGKGPWPYRLFPKVNVPQLIQKI